MTQQDLPLDEEEETKEVVHVNPAELIHKLFRHEKHIGYKLKDFSETLTTFKNYFDNNYNGCEKTTLIYSGNELLLELILNAERAIIIKVTINFEYNRFSYIFSSEGSVVEAVSGNLNELFPEMFK